MEGRYGHPKHRVPYYVGLFFYLITNSAFSQNGNIVLEDIEVPVVKQKLGDIFGGVAGQKIGEAVCRMPVLEHYAQNFRGFSIGVFGNANGQYLGGSGGCEIFVLRDDRHSQRGKAQTGSFCSGGAGIELGKASGSATVNLTLYFGACRTPQDIAGQSLNYGATVGKVGVRLSHSFDLESAVNWATNRPRRTVTDLYAQLRSMEKAVKSAHDTYIFFLEMHKLAQSGGRFDKVAPPTAEEIDKLKKSSWLLTGIELEADRIRNVLKKLDQRSFAGVEEEVDSIAKELKTIAKDFDPSRRNHQTIFEQLDPDLKNKLKESKIIMYDPKQGRFTTVRYSDFPSEVTGIERQDGGKIVGLHVRNIFTGTTTGRHRFMLLPEGRMLQGEFIGVDDLNRLRHQGRTDLIRGDIFLKNSKLHDAMIASTGEALYRGLDLTAVLESHARDGFKQFQDQAIFNGCKSITLSMNALQAANLAGGIWDGLVKGGNSREVNRLRDASNSVARLVGGVTAGGGIGHTEILGTPQMVSQGRTFNRFFTEMDHQCRGYEALTRHEREDFSSTSVAHDAPLQRRAEPAL